MKTLTENNYIIINDESQSQEQRQILLTPADAYQFPLSPDDMDSVRRLEQAFDAQGKIAGLAAPQIGIAKQAIIFMAPAEMKKWRTDFTHVLPKTIWLNPHYEAIGEAVRVDYEGCFSVNDLAGKVPRFQKIKYTAYLLDGSKIEGIEEGYNARIIQHEIDHLKGILFTAKTPQDQLLTLEEYYKIRNAKMGDN